jgi:hypothetical protein
LPSLRVLELGLYNVAAKDLPEILSARAQLSKLQTLDCKGFCFTAPFTEKGELTVRQWGLFSAEHERIVGVLKTLPEGVVSRVLLRPHNEDPTAFAPPPPTEAQLASLRADVPKQRFEVEWH